MLTCFGRFISIKNNLRRKKHHRQNQDSDFLERLLTFTLSPVEYFTIEHSKFTSFEKTKITTNWDFSQTSKQIYRQLQYKEKVFEEFQGLFCFPRKIVLYSLTKFGIIRPSTNIVWLRRFNLGFWQTSKQVYRNLRCRENVAWKFQGLPHLSRKMLLHSLTKFVAF